jgi:hypothetical protein
MASYRPEPDVFLDALPRADAPAAVPAHGSAPSSERDNEAEPRPASTDALGATVSRPKPQSRSEDGALFDDLLDRARDSRLRAACSPCSPIDVAEHATRIADVLRRALTNPGWR